MPSINLALFQGYDGIPSSDLFFTEIAEANLGTMQELRWSSLDQLISCLGILKKRNIVLVAKVRNLYGVWPFGKEDRCIGNIG